MVAHLSYRSTHFQKELRCSRGRLFCFRCFHFRSNFKVFLQLLVERRHSFFNHLVKTFVFFNIISLHTSISPTTCVEIIEHFHTLNQVFSTKPELFTVVQLFEFIFGEKSCVVGVIFTIELVGTKLCVTPHIRVFPPVPQELVWIMH